MSTPPDSPTKGLASSQATVKHLKHLFDVLSKVLPDLTNRGPTNTHVFQEHHQPGPGMVQLKQLLVKLIDDGYSSFGHFVATKPAQFYLADNQLGEDAQAKNAR
ncbi:uncharacterized protein N7515_010210 [Penicillium bovifimosum]|uniref:Uncharacterized protein n=1 Tax=Penicillium bovifimosum TaxID=126998 RepID=A0A9W9GJE9_9EURO|nr:uncharacterized protein N7515_010210 [Penicillium bovifimosum]KAJ5120822.1 hypothetical protein N7515_010210 [Penicillium bovifimosum]